jgi:hypothetical protein
MRRDLTPIPRRGFAREALASQGQTGIQHSPGAAAGGPVFIPKIYGGRNRTFLYFSYETSRGSATQQSLTPTAAPAAWRSGNLASAAVVITDPFGNDAPFPDNVIPANRINPGSLK